jgi:hypothetical protein
MAGTDFNFDEEELKQQDADAAKKKNLYNAVGGAFDALSNRRSAADFLLGTPQQKPTAGNIWRDAAANIKDPLEEKEKMAKAYLQNQGVIKAKDDQSQTDLTKDPNSAVSMAAKQMAKEKFGYVPKPEDSAFSLGSVLDPKRIGEIQAQAQINSQNEDRKLATEHKYRMEEENNKAENKKGAAKNEGEKALDRDYAKTYNDWTGNGRASLVKNLQSLREARQALKDDPSLTGGLTGIAGDRFTADRVLKQRQKVQSAIQNSLRATLGAQFTENEGNRVLKNAYNEAASAEANGESLDAAIKMLESQAANNDSKAKHFERNGTLTGYVMPTGESTQPATVRIKAPNGKIKEIPADQAKAAVAAGGTLVDSTAGQ